MLIVGRIEIREVEGPELRRRVEGVRPQRPSGAGHHLRHPQLQGPERARRPLLDEGHLYAGGGVDAVSRFDQARQQHRIQPRLAVVVLDRVADGVDAAAVVLLEEA